MSKHAGPWMTFTDSYTPQGRHHRVADTTDEADERVRAQVVLVPGGWWRPGHGYIR